MRTSSALATLFVALTALPVAAADKPRLLVLTDIGEDPDDQQSMIRLMVHANEFEIEGLIATASGFPGERKKEEVRPHLIREIVEAYGKVQPNLVKHHPDFPNAKTLHNRIKAGNPIRGVESLGQGKDTDGSNWIISAVDRKDVRPLNVVIWGGSTELAQALWRVRNDRTADQLKQFIGKLRVYAIGHQDNTGPWIIKEFPDLFYILSKAPDGRDKREGGYRGMYLGGDESLTSREWVDKFVRKDHGPLGALYPTNTWTAPNPHATLKEGDTPSWFYFLPFGPGDAKHPEWGNWGGRFKHVAGGLYEDARDEVGKKTAEARSNVYRWRPAYQNEFAARMDWCVKAPKDTNHPPVVTINGKADAKVIELAAKVGDSLTLTAAGSSDPDENSLTFRWAYYRETGKFDGEVPHRISGEKELTFEIPKTLAGTTAQFLLEVTDRGTPPLTRYGRVVVTVR